MKAMKNESPKKRIYERMVYYYGNRKENLPEKTHAGSGGYDAVQDDPGI